MKKFNGISKKTTINTFYDFCIRYFFIILLQKRSKKKYKEKGKKHLKRRAQDSSFTKRFFATFSLFYWGVIGVI